jgi:tRNA pseudouridine38-40 synthase
MRYFLHFAYHGFPYHGWQRQPTAISVQEILEGALLKVLKKPVALTGCGRTDAQVHASQFFCHFDLEELPDYDLLFRLNKTLPADIALFDLLPVHEKSHARFDAVSRTYNYFIHLYKDPFLATSSAGYPDENLNLGQMKAAVDLLPRYQDYYAFCRSPANYKHTECRVSAAQLLVNQRGNRLRFQITANRFLTGMIRIIVQKLLEIGRGQLPVEAFEHYLKNKQTPAVIRPAYPQGLYLSKVTYPYLDLPASTDFAAIFQEQEYWKAV